MNEKFINIKKQQNCKFKNGRLKRIANGNAALNETDGNVSEAAEMRKNGTDRHYDKQTKKC